MPPGCSSRRRAAPEAQPAGKVYQVGWLASYWPNSAEMFRRAAGYVHRILSGSRPGDLAIERPTKLLLVVNLETARALGLTIPPSLLLRADRVIE